MLGMSALGDVGVTEALSHMETFFAYVSQGGVLASRREIQASEALMQALHEGLLEQFLKNPNIAGEVERIRLDVAKGRMMPGLAARHLINQFTEDRGNS